MSSEISIITASKVPVYNEELTIVSAQNKSAWNTVEEIKAKISSAYKISSDILTTDIFAPRKFLNETYLGVDITPSCIYVCQIENKNGVCSLTSLASACMKGKFVGEDILSNPELYSQTLKQLIKDNKIKTSKVAVSLPVSSSIVKVATISKMDDEDINKAIRYGALWQNLMHTSDSADNYSIFYQIIRREETSETMDILIVATKLSDIKLYKDIVMRSGLKPVIIDAKCMALHNALKKRPGSKIGNGTILIEFSLDDNYIMALGNEKPRIFDMFMTDSERAAILGNEANGDEALVNQVISRYKKKIESIIATYKKLKPGIAIEDIYIISALPVFNNFIKKLANSVQNCNIHECSMFDYLVIPDNFSISKESAMHNISSWAGAISMAIMPQKTRKEEWIEVKKSPNYGLKLFRHYNTSKVPEIYMEIDTFRPSNNIIQIQKESTLARIATYPNIAALAASVFVCLLVLKSYFSVLDTQMKLAYQERNLSPIALEYNSKTEQLSYLEDSSNKVDAINEYAQIYASEENQNYVLGIYHYLNSVMQDGVWLKQLNFTAPNNIEIEGRSFDDKGIFSFINTLENSKVFDKISLKHMRSIAQMDLFSLSSTSVKGFALKGSTAEEMPVE